MWGQYLLGVQLRESSNQQPRPPGPSRTALQCSELPSLSQDPWTLGRFRDCAGLRSCLLSTPWLGPCGMPAPGTQIFRDKPPAVWTVKAHGKPETLCAIVQGEILPRACRQSHAVGRSSVPSTAPLAGQRTPPPNLRVLTVGGVASEASLKVCLRLGVVPSLRGARASLRGSTPRPGPAFLTASQPTDSVGLARGYKQLC